MRRYSFEIAARKLADVALIRETFWEHIAYAGQRIQQIQPFMFQTVIRGFKIDNKVSVCGNDENACARKDRKEKRAAFTLLRRSHLAGKIHSPRIGSSARESRCVYFIKVVNPR